MRILALAPEVPVPPLTGGKTRTCQLLRGLATKHDVRLVAFTWQEQSPPIDVPFEVTPVVWQRPPLYGAMLGEDAEAAAAAYQALAARPEPFFVSYYGSSGMDDALRKTAREAWDLVLIEHSIMGLFLSALPSHVPWIVDLHNVHTLMAEREVERSLPETRSREGRELARTRSFEGRVLSQCDVCLTVSEREAGAVRRLFGARDVRVIPNGVDTRTFEPSSAAVSAGSLLFTGLMSYQANIEAVRHFTADVLPLIRRRIPGACFHVAGANPDEAVHRLASDAVIVHGSVPDMRPYYHAAAVVVVPLRHGGGTRLKILEAAACGKAIVSTAIGAEGLDFVDGRDIVLADSAEAFADAVVHLVHDPDRRRELEANARRAAMRYEWDDINRRLLGIVDELRGRVSAREPGAAAGTDGSIGRTPASRPASPK